MYVLDFINTRRACARGLQYSVCLSVCYQSSSFFSSLYTYLHVFARFLGFELTDFDKTVFFFWRESTFNVYFVVSTPHEQFRILHVLAAITVTWSVPYNARLQYYFCQLSKFDHVAAAQLASDLSD